MQIPLSSPLVKRLFLCVIGLFSVDATLIFHLLRDALCWSVLVIQRVHVCSEWTLIQTNNRRYKNNIVHKHLSSSDVLHNFPSSLDAFYTLSWLDIVIVRKKKQLFCIILHNIYSCSYFICLSTLGFFFCRSTRWANAMSFFFIKNVGWWLH